MFTDRAGKLNEVHILVAFPKGFTPMSISRSQSSRRRIPFTPRAMGSPIAENTPPNSIGSSSSKRDWNSSLGTIPRLCRRPDLFWYPVEGKPKIRTAPDTLVVFGRPKGDRGAYIQFREDGIPPRSSSKSSRPATRPSKMTEKFRFYAEYGVEEYYIYDPDHIKLTGYRRQDGKLRVIPEMNGWVSPRLGVRFDLSGPELKFLAPAAGAS